MCVDHTLRNEVAVFSAPHLTMSLFWVLHGEVVDISLVHLLCATTKT